MIDKEKQVNINSSEKNVKYTFSPTMIRHKAARRSLFTNLKNEQKRRTQINLRYFNHHQIQLLAEFFELPEINALSVDDLLSCQSADMHKAELQKILKRFILGQADSVRTAKRLDKFIDESRPLAWQVWRLFDHWRYQKLKTFIEGFKCNCLKEVLQDVEGYKDAPNLFNVSEGLISQDAEAANFVNTNLRVISYHQEGMEEKQKDTLFLNLKDSTEKTEITYTKPTTSLANAQTGSFFRRDD